MDSHPGGFKQEMPPKGGFKPIDFVRKQIKRPWRGHLLIAGTYLWTYAGITLWITPQRQRYYYQKQEAQEVRIAAWPFVLAERNRLYLKHLIKLRDAESELMKDVPDWKVGHWFSTPIFHNPRGLWIDPLLYGFYALNSKKDYKYRRFFHHYFV
ncbi:hypothetical protein BOX15_Mlig028948g3 [Macrostomum lignano]|uniref:NADH dehydrogenase [ubiquinone] 1 alpha subcomplex subunit 13 n=1 Tax=Macrostomum lignano TaxID=282301 RepID=A0A267DWN1_9PLAT|nr:hypothetical protein BOX15_Mlig028948g1 [Macrostomum lignano]PAA60583.1 hypothetical protein BOX15_Mlig025427g2 [Macrostomum lignano]PAA92302.1 hypothetical protein BOX15_Mlig028948g3 [Macrostomum lignano]